MDSLAVAICEDTPADRERLEAAILSAKIPCACDWYERGEGLLEHFRRGKYDLVFLDIFMGGMTGVEVARLIREADPDVMLAFVTTSSDFAMEGYRSRVERYLLKPYTDQDVHEVLASAMRRAENPTEEVLDLGRDGPIPHSRIVFAEQSNHATIIHLTEGDEVKRTGRLDDIEQMLPYPPFYRGHKSFLVNLDHVRCVNRELKAFEMDDGHFAYIRRASVREAQRAFEERLIACTRALKA